MLNFLCIGAQKAGTTWLHEQLQRHPRVGFPGGKEVHYWNARRRELPEQWYLDLFDGGDERVNGDITPAYSTLDAEVVARIHALFPRLAVFFILRNPLDRAWSAALMALQRAELELDEASDAWFVDHFHSRGSLLRGDYERTLRIWRGFFGEQLKVLYYEDIAGRPLQVLDSVCTALGIEPAAEWSLDSVSQPVFKGQGAALRDSLKPVLAELYADRIASLGAYLGRDLSGWMHAAGR